MPETEPTDPALTEPAAPFGRGPIRILAGARMVSISGSMAAGIALSISIYARTHSGWWLAMFFLFSFGITGLLAPLAGTIGDRFDRRRVMIVSELVGAALMVPLLFTSDPLQIVILGFLVAVAHQPLWATVPAVVPNLAGPDHLEWANSLVSMSFSVGAILGPLLGGVLAGLAGPHSVIAFDIVTFLVSAVLIATIHGHFGGSKQDLEEGPGVMAGYRFVFSNRTLRALALAWAVVAFALDVVLVADLPLVHELNVAFVAKLPMVDPAHATSFAYGLLVTAWAGGAIVGALLARRLSERTEPRGILVGIAGVAVGYALISISPMYAMIFVLMIGTAICDSLGGVAGNSFIQRRTPDYVRARVFSAVTSLWLLANVVAFPTAGAVDSAFGPRAVYAMGAIVAIVATVMILPVLRAAPAEATEPQVS